MALADQSRPEILAPVGSFETLKTALDWGADAVYLGCGRLNARSERAAFAAADLPEIVSQCRAAGVRPYLTLNTVIYEDEMDEALALASQAEAAGIAAVIVQDYGLAAELIRQFPQLEIHASTQMTVGSPAALERAGALGIKRVILPRESTLETVGKMTALAQKLGIEIEVFVQGALCVSVSGQCHLSRLRGGRSANRGACACPCRQGWSLVNGAGKTIKNGPILSPKDQCNLMHVKALQVLGVHSFKIEGRLRRPSYLAAAITAYRQALTAAGPSQQERDQLLLAYNRGGAFTDAFMGGRDGRNFLSGPYVGHMGILAGEVADVSPKTGRLFVSLAGEGKAFAEGDLVAIRRGETETEISTVPAAKVRQEGHRIIMQGFHPQVLAEIRLGDRIYRLASAAFEKAVEQKERTGIPVEIAVEQEASGTVTFTAWLSDRPAIQTVQQFLPETDSIPEEELEKSGPAYRPLSADRLKAQLKKSGGTAFAVMDVTIRGKIFLPVKIACINQIRRDLLNGLDTAMNQSAEADLALRRSVEKERKAKLRAARRDQPATPYLAGPRTGQSAGRKFKTAHKPEAGRIRVSLPAYRPGQLIYTDPAIRLALPVQSLLDLEVEVLSALADRVFALEAILPVEADWTDWQAYDDFLNQNEVALTYLSGILTSQAVKKGAYRLPVFGDSGLNVINTIAASTLLEDLRGLILSPELKIAETVALLAELTNPGLEVWLYGREPAMYMKHCPVGLRRQGCHRCRAQSFVLRDGQRGSYPLTCFPERGCRTALWADRVTDRRTAETLIRQPDLMYRLNFIDESVADQEAVVKQTMASLASG